MDAVEFGEYLKNLRENAGLSMGQLSRAAKVSQPYISQLESGQRGVPSPEIIKKLHSPLNISYSEMMFKAGHIDSKMLDLITNYEEIEIELKSALLTTLAAFTDGVGYFKPELRRDVFNAFKDHVMGPDFYEFNDRFEAMLIEKDEDPENINADDEEDFYEQFDRLYNMRNLSYQLIEYISDESKEKILSQLKSIAETKYIAVPKKDTSNKSKDLIEILEDPQLTYSGQVLSRSDRDRIISVLEILFPER
ncbi:hypothetical protein J31TS4_40700 [Paenibacillus sp. J31TS4]|uniref:helix-turn-helix domain-containing protein n=1 Tax=Paenibacillus sp. J31TS4 TaxID=2807195 RepID=UPI001B29269D|nr:helix-turn-helix transcriptional regulator [Paenibacillus sp. J31TS4]GIP40790.1 hypothetical protein J31TS4_40700 [Paenibacillus sp. J31TS4]